MNAAEQQFLARILTNEIELERWLADGKDALSIADVDLRRFAAGLAQKRICSIRGSRGVGTDKRRTFERDVRDYVRSTPAPMSGDPHADAKCFTRWRRRQSFFPIVIVIVIGRCLRRLAGRDE